MSCEYCGSAYDRGFSDGRSKHDSEAYYLGTKDEQKRIKNAILDIFRNADADIYNKILDIVEPCYHKHIKVGTDLFGIVHTCMDCGYNVRV